MILGQFPQRKIAHPTLTLTLIETLTLTGGNFPRRELSGHQI